VISIQIIVSLGNSSPTGSHSSCWSGHFHCQRIFWRKLASSKSPHFSEASPYSGCCQRRSFARCLRLVLTN
jgi:hypothetical protein